MVDYTTALMFLIGISMVAIEPIVARHVSSQRHQATKLITLTMVFIGSGLMLPEIPRVLEALGESTPSIYFLAPFGVILARFAWQYVVDLRGMRDPQLKLFYTFLFVVGLLELSAILYDYYAMTYIIFTEPESI